MVVSANWFNVRLIDSAPVLHSVAKVLKAHICIRREVLSAPKRHNPKANVTSFLIGVAAVRLELVGGNEKVHESRTKQSVVLILKSLRKIEMIDRYMRLYSYINRENCIIYCTIR